ncbi:dihydropteroate synthase [Dactylonectria estremocensis]|uniref:dihydroneopterin aldolase n=1 Tax=Dactylonectria estremocensis TaxID=1079267 RepID=A0A9P9FKC3_9HYPO|nr:dihydropteroate synthase [Dactylonectria estremocensis]
MAVSLQTAWQLQIAEGQPSAAIRVRNVQSTIQGPHDAWGRPGRPQPILVSAEISLVQPFGRSSSADQVAPDTVHYGLLSKAIIATLKRLEMQAADGQVATLHGVLSSIWSDLTGLNTLGASVNADKKEPFLALAFVRRLSVSIVLPKASLIGSGVSLSASAVFQESSMTARGLVLNLEGLRVPTLIGVNPNERLAKQIVVANIGIEKYRNDEDDYVPLEAVVVDAMTESSFETLEALATKVASHITKHLKSDLGNSPSTQSWHLQIGFEKPTAVPFADAACVELRTSTDDVI